MPTDYIVATIMYLLSLLLDEFDGNAARYFNQCASPGFSIVLIGDFHTKVTGMLLISLRGVNCRFWPVSLSVSGMEVTIFAYSGITSGCTRFGSMLDMLTDRCVTTALLVILGLFYPKYIFIFQMLICLDIASHWIHVQSSLLKGGASHKDVDNNTILRIYYESRMVLFIMGVGNELFFCMLYLLHFTSGPILSVGGVKFSALVAFAWLTLPICFLKQVVSIIQLIVACINTARLDESERERVNK
ncbi:unnamed protein product [Porites lobata]|uniref:CDP-diacylglycerol--inositol 3-phosphatidyltransferase n=1 Tax=Porites lobata TaxID=104759 RepID=A0ABN8NFI8_9CNID|nr:unnamed protein product [Porites lobata]